ncbi:hypothetical protein [Streptomyces sp.]|uniref:hypothetical protein n=1 Tax=Streptomyces sp. TaxID=1931 RepID=UPI002F95C374
MLDDAARKHHYLTQTGRRELTPRQKRRAYKKWLHQSQEAAARREGVAAIRRSAAERKAERARFRLGVQAASS